MQSFLDISIECEALIYLLLYPGDHKNGWIGFKLAEPPPSPLPLAVADE